MRRPGGDLIHVVYIVMRPPAGTPLKPVADLAGSSMSCHVLGGLGKIVGSPEHHGKKADKIHCLFLTSKVGVVKTAGSALSHFLRVALSGI